MFLTCSKKVTSANIFILREIPLYRIFQTIKEEGFTKCCLRSGWTMVLETIVTCLSSALSYLRRRPGVGDPWVSCRTLGEDDQQWLEIWGTGCLLWTHSLRWDKWPYIYSLSGDLQMPFLHELKISVLAFFFNPTSLLQILNIWRKLIPELEHHKLHWTQPKLVIAFDFFQSNWTVYEACISTP